MKLAFLRFVVRSILLSTTIVLPQNPIRKKLSDDLRDEQLTLCGRSLSREFLTGVLICQSLIFWPKPEDEMASLNLCDTLKTLPVECTHAQKGLAEHYWPHDAGKRDHLRLVCT